MKKARRSLADTRLLLLETGAAMVTESGPNVTIGDILLIDVCRAAGLKTTGSGYRIWPNQDEFRVDVLRYLAEETLRDRTTAEGLRAAASDVEKQLGITELIRQIGALNAERTIDGHAEPMYIALWLAGLHDEELGDVVRSSDTQRVENYAQLYTKLIESYGREFVPPYDAELLAVTLSALMAGLTIKAHSHPEIINTERLRATGADGQDQPWHMFAAASEAIIMTYTRPVEP